jgi:hypothetical protein
MNQTFMCVIWFFLCCCSTILIVVYDQFGTSPHLPCVNLGMKTLDPPSRFFFWYGFQIMLLVSFCFCVDANVYLFTYFGETFFMFQIQFLFVIKLGSILTWVNMFVVCKIHIFCLTLHFILHIHFLHEERRDKWVILTL